MRYVLIIATLVFAVFAIANNASEDGVINSATETVVSRVRYADLLAKPAEEKIQIPIRGINAKQIANTWQAPRGADRLHQGQDIFARGGTPVHSATAGYVWKIGQNNLGGNIVTVLGAGGRVYYYAHLDRFAPNLAVGDAVTTDTVIGYVGTSGNAAGTPPHLHFGVYTIGGAVDPLTLF
jgi:murein DD-endopeptidase MepM/ murein hydrolase activator NlpD